jgi:hypothetical protein
VLEDAQNVREIYSRIKEAGVGIKFDCKRPAPILCSSVWDRILSQSRFVLLSRQRPWGKTQTATK